MSVGNFAILAFVDPIGIVTMPSGMEIFESQVHGSLCWTPGGSCMEWQIKFPSRRGDILLRAPPNFGSFRAAKMTPFWDSNFTPPVWSIGGPISVCPRGACTQFQVGHSDMSPRSCLLSCEPLASPWPGKPRVRMMPISVILAAGPHLTNPCCPDAGTSEGTRLGEGFREFVFEEHRVSCLVPTSGGSGRGVNLGDF